MTTFTKGQQFKYYGSTITLIERVIVPEGDKMVPYWVYLEQKGVNAICQSDGKPHLTPESDLIELFSESLAANTTPTEVKESTKKATEPKTQKRTRKTAVEKTDKKATEPKTQKKTRKTPGITSPQDFGKVAMKAFKKLLKTARYEGMVPIYQLRRELGDAVSRENFDKWMLELQGNDIFLLVSGEVFDLTPDKKADSIEIPGFATRYYVKLA